MDVCSEPVPSAETLLIDAPSPAAFLRITCPRCRDSIVSVPANARFCPRCGLTLPDHCPAWAVPPGTAISLPAVSRGWSNWLQSFRAGIGVSQSPAGSPVTLMAYVNALLNLGLHYESALGAGRNLPQARRYLQKAARLGNEPAKARLAMAVLPFDEAEEMHPRMVTNEHE